ncbi:MAG: hypothetical protein NTZ05_15075 [Chloroflexi bacterium]|nr:hypothetical protein [Chloroflexota bacterium]
MARGCFLVRYEVQLGDAVKLGATLAVLTIDKRETMIKSPASGIVTELPLTPPHRYTQDEVLAVIAAG